MAIDPEVFFPIMALVILFALGISKAYGWWYARYIAPYEDELAEDAPDTSPVDLARRRRGPGLLERSTVRALTSMRAQVDQLKTYVKSTADPVAESTVHAGSEPGPATGSTAFARHGTERTPPFAAEPTYEPDEPEPALVIMPDQVEAVRAMIDYALGESRRGEKPSKTRRIQAGFKIGRGASPRYQQASMMYDLLFGDPEPAVKYRSLGPDGKPVLKEEPYG